MKDVLPIIISIIAGFFSICATLVGCAWVLANKIGDMKASFIEKTGTIQAELVGIRAVLDAHNTRLQRVERKIDEGHPPA